MDHIVFILSSVEGHLSSFHSLALVDIAAVILWYPLYWECLSWKDVEFCQMLGLHILRWSYNFFHYINTYQTYRFDFWRIILLSMVFLVGSSFLSAFWICNPSVLACKVSAEKLLIAIWGFTCRWQASFLLLLLRFSLWEHLGSAVLKRLPSAQGVIPAFQDRVPHQAPPLGACFFLSHPPLLVFPLLLAVCPINK